MAVVTRFAPSPTGPLHLGHAYAALFAFDLAVSVGGTFLLRIEDIDRSRCRAHWERQIYEDLRWLGIDWPMPVLRQSENLAAYDAALQQLAALGLTYPCSCNRADIRAAMTAPQEGVPIFGPDGLVYPGTCRARAMADAQPADVIRLNIAKAVELLEGKIQYQEGRPPDQIMVAATADFVIKNVGDVVLARRDMGTSYHLAVVVDDADQGITCVTRGEDLKDATLIHVVLQRLLGFPTPNYLHHRLIRDNDGKRLAKRDDARALEKYRADGASPADIRHMIGL